MSFRMRLPGEMQLGSDEDNVTAIEAPVTPPENEPQFRSSVIGDRDRGFRDRGRDRGIATAGPWRATTARRA